jgi:hypothetical protein
MIALLLMWMGSFTLSEQMPQPQDRPPGMRVNLTVGTLFVPEGYKPPDGRINLVIHLHGTAQVAEQNLMRSGEQAVLVTVALKGLSKVYTDLFAKPESFRSILDETLTQLKQLKIAENPTIGRVCITSFSAGFGGVRELLKVEEFYQRIDVLVMADSIYAGFVGDLAQRQVDPNLMSGFLRFARDAAEGRKVLIVTYSQVKTDYASTAETANYLLTQIGGEAETVEEIWAEGWQCMSRFKQKGLQIYSFAGDTGADHLKHLHYLWKLMRLLQK